MTPEDRCNDGLPAKPLVLSQGKNEPNARLLLRA
jgi:hypothetical protein